MQVHFGGGKNNSNNLRTKIRTFETVQQNNHQRAPLRVKSVSRGPPVFPDPLSNSHLIPVACRVFSSCNCKSHWLIYWWITTFQWNSSLLEFLSERLLTVYTVYFFSLSLFLWLSAFITLFVHILLVPRSCPNLSYIGVFFCFLWMQHEMKPNPNPDQSITGPAVNSTFSKLVKMLKTELEQMWRYYFVWHCFLFHPSRMYV